MLTINGDKGVNYDGYTIATIVADRANEFK